MKAIVMSIWLVTTTVYTSFSQTVNSAESTSHRLIESVIEAWDKHNSFTLLILSSLKEEYLNDHSTSKGRSVGEQFAHIYEVRLNWLEVISPESAKSLKAISGEKMSIQALKEILVTSSEEVKRVLLTGLKNGTLNGYEGHPMSFYSYLVSHESHHRGQILLSLKQSGHEVPPQISYGIWNW